MSLMRIGKFIVLLLTIIFLSGCVTQPPPSTPTPSPSPTPVTIETLLQSLNGDKEFTPGYKAYYPISASPTMSQLINMGPKALPDILAAMQKSQDPQYRKALLFVVAHIDDPKSEETLISSLEDTDLKGLSAYLLGNYQYRPANGEFNKPDKFIRQRNKVLNALFPLLRDNKEYTISADKFKANTKVGDLAIASFIRIGGLKNFDIDQNKYRWIGWEIPLFTDNVRKELLLASETFYEKSGGGEAYPPPDGFVVGEIPVANKNQTNISVANGTFTFVKEKNNTTPNQLEVTFNFTALSSLNCTKIRYIQIARLLYPNGTPFYPGGAGGRQAGRATGDGWFVDRWDDLISPYYGTGNDGSDQSNSHSGRPGGDDAYMHDKPGLLDPSPGYGGYRFDFETCAVCAEGPDSGKCYGCITWGFTVNNDGSVTPSSETSSNGPSEKFKQAADRWNNQGGNTAIPRAGW